VLVGLNYFPVAGMRPPAIGLLGRSLGQKETAMLYSPPGTLVNITGRQLAQLLARLDKRGRARLAVDIQEGRVEITDFTTTQLAKLVKVSTSYINEARHPRRASAEKLLRTWSAADTDQRVAFARKAGAERIFDVLTAAID
jgi:hypothetical protein